MATQKNDGVVLNINLRRSTRIKKSDKENHLNNPKGNVSNSVSDKAPLNGTVRTLPNRKTIKRKSDQKENVEMVKAPKRTRSTSRYKKKEESVQSDHLKVKKLKGVSANTKKNVSNVLSNNVSNFTRSSVRNRSVKGNESNLKKINKRSTKKGKSNKISSPKRITHTPNSRYCVECPKKNKDRKIAKASRNRKKNNENKMEDEKQKTAKENIEKRKVPKEYSSTFKKYGIYIPSYEDILETKKQYNEYIEQIEKLEKLIKPLPVMEELKVNVINSNPTSLLNCMHLSFDEITAAFKNNLDYLSKIRDGSIYCKRHEQFKEMITRNELTYNTSTILFTNEQKQMLLVKMCKTFGNSSSLSDYYIKVLLPELCLKIFMDLYNKTNEEASKYLDEYPVEM